MADFDVIDFLHTLATHSGTHSGVLLNADAAGIMLADQDGGLHVMASSAEETRLVELHELQTTKADTWTTSAPDTRARDDLPAMR